MSGSREQPVQRRDVLWGAAAVAWARLPGQAPAQDFARGG